MRSFRQPPVAMRASVIAVQSALAVLATVSLAHAADDPAVAELTQPTNSVEAGIVYVDKDSAKFGEYNGLDRKGARANLGFEIRGGGGYDRESGRVDRWRIGGSNLGLGNRYLSGDYSHQGGYGIRFEYDEIERNQFDSFKSLWRGVGSSTLTLPPQYPPASARTTTSGLANWNNTQAPNLNATTTGGGPGYVIPALVQNADIGTTRKRFGLGGEVYLTPEWSIAVNARTERKDGTKLTGTSFGGFTSGALLPEPIDSDTTIVETQARYTTKTLQFGIGYNLSLYRNNISRWTAENPLSNNAMLNNLAVMSAPPDNQMHQLTLDGAWRFSPTMKLVLAGSQSRLTQDDAFVYQGNTGWIVPAPSANAKELQTNFLARLNANPLKDLDLSAAYKYDHRDNRTPIRTFVVQQRADIPGVPTAADNTFTNVPLDRKVDTLSLDGRYTIKRGQIVSAGLEHQRITREADHPAGTPEPEVFASGKSTEDTIKLGWRQAISDTVNGRIGYQHARRRAHDYEEPTVNPPDAHTNPGFFGELPGFRQFFLNDRNRDKVRASVDFQPSEALYVQAGVDYIEDRFPARFGLKKTDSQAWNLDATYAVSEKLSFNGFVTYEDANSRQEQFAMPAARGVGVPPVIPHAADGTCAPYTTAYGIPSDYLTDPCRNWSVTQADKVWTLGLGAKSTQFMGGRLTLSADVTYTRARTNLNLTGGTYYNNGIGQNVYIPAQNMPAITSTLTDIRLGAAYAINKQSKVKFGWQHQRLRSTDPQFDLFGITSVQGYIGSGLTSPNYTVNAITVSYVYSFR